MKKIFILFFLLQIGTIVFAQESKMQDVVESKIKNTFLKSLSENLIYSGETYSSYTIQPAFDLTACNKNFVFYNCFSNKEKRKTLPHDITMGLFDKSKGNFLVTFVTLESNDHYEVEDWLYTFNYSGKKIDSLCVNRMYDIGRFYISDNVAYVDEFFNVQVVTIVDAEENRSINRQGDLPDNWYGIRKDISYTLTENGHFKMESEFTYPKKIYTYQDLLLSKERSIYHGNESVDCIIRPRPRIDF